MLDYNLDGIGMPLKVYLFTSLDGKEYRLASIKDTLISRTIGMMHGLKTCYLINWMKASVI